MKPSDEEARHALNVLEAAGFELHHADLLFMHNRKRQASIKKAIADAKQGDREAALRLISWFAGDLDRAGWLDSAELRSYFAEAFRVIAAEHDDPATALKLKVSHRAIDPAIKSKRRRAASLVNVLKDAGSEKDAVAKTAELLNCDVRTVRRYMAAQKDIDEEFQKLQVESKDAINPPGVIVIT